MTEQWQPYRDLVMLVDCPTCAFTFSADHENTDGTGYSCPGCENERLRAALREVLGWNEHASEGWVPDDLLKVVAATLENGAGDS